MTHCFPVTDFLPASPVLCAVMFFLDAICLFQANSISCLVFSESLPLDQGTNPNLASLVIIINVLFTTSSRSLIKMLYEIRMKSCPCGIQLRHLPRTPHSVICCFTVLCLPCELRPSPLQEAESLIFLPLQQCLLRAGIVKPGRS